jgi:hypothetical protein
MGDILDTLQALQHTPVPNLLVIGGFILLFLAFVGRFGAFVDLPQSRQKWAGMIGAVLLILGVGLFILPASPPSTTAQATPLPPTNTSTEANTVPSPPTGTPTNTAAPTHTPTNPPSPTPRPAKPSEDCIGFDPGKIEVTKSGGRWKIVEGSNAILDFEDKQAEANTAFNIITHYTMDEICFVGRPDPSMEYFLVNGNAPNGAFAGEDCIGFNPDGIEVTNSGGRWKIVDGSNSMLDFEDKQAEANSAFAILTYYQFNHICFVGRPNASMTYFRR